MDSQFQLHFSFRNLSARALGRGRVQQGGFDVSEEYLAAEAADYAAQAAAAESDDADEAAPTASAPSAAVVQAEEPQVLTSADRAARLRRLDQRHDDAPGA